MIAATKNWLKNARARRLANEAVLEQAHAISGDYYLIRHLMESGIAVPNQETKCYDILTFSGEVLIENVPKVLVESVVSYMRRVYGIRPATVHHEGEFYSLTYAWDKNDNREIEK